MAFLHTRAQLLLRLALGINFFWTGVLTLFNVSPIIPLIRNSFPQGIGDSQLFIFIVALFEILIGTSYLFNRFVKATSSIMIVSLSIMSIPVFILQGFSPRFPVLSLAGEMTLKNFVIVAAGLILIAEKDVIPSEKNNYKHKNNI